MPASNVQPNGSAVSGASMPGGGHNIQGWLSAMYLNGMPVSITGGSIPAGANIIGAVAQSGPWTTSVGNFPLFAMESGGNLDAIVAGQSYLALEAGNVADLSDSLKQVGDLMAQILDRLDTIIGIIN